MIKPLHQLIRGTASKFPETLKEQVLDKEIGCQLANSLEAGEITLPEDFGEMVYILVARAAWGLNACHLSDRELCTAGLAQMDKFFPVPSHAGLASASNDALMSDAIYSMSRATETPGRKRRRSESPLRDKAKKDLAPEACWGCGKIGHKKFECPKRK